MCNTNEGHSCIFPFKYKNKTYRQCIYGDDNHSWCPYQINANLTTNKMDWCKRTNCSEESIGYIDFKYISLYLRNRPGLKRSLKLIKFSTPLSSIK